ncbi:MAG: hypothetical protein Q4B64_06610 [Spirochaetales bacterium]|nr:hypothetical protein [Spirochaetales bacterium]
MIPQLLLEEINLGEKNARDYYDKYGKEELEKALAELRKSDEEILAAYPMKEMQEKFEEKTSASEKRNVLSFRSYRTWAMSAAAALAVFLCAPFMYNSFKAGKSEIRVKGNSSSGSQIRLYRQEGSDVVKLSSGDRAKENDVIQITYIPADKNYGIIFSLDGNGNITRHFPEDNWAAGKLVKNGEEVPLSFSYRLDDAPEFECFVFVSSRDEFAMEELEGLSKLQPEYLKDAKHFPKNTEATFFVLKK